VETRMMAQKRKVGREIGAMGAKIGRDLGIERRYVKIKGKRKEKVGYVGGMEAMEGEGGVLVEKG
uniref:2-C-methyl-D-erythritol 2,4-cyclodiphosphate synthase n=1 Tax=Neisseria sicca TaxID=490 RepID=UPI0034D96A84